MAFYLLTTLINNPENNMKKYTQRKLRMGEKDGEDIISDWHVRGLWEQGLKETLNPRILVGPEEGTRWWVERGKREM